MLIKYQKIKQIQQEEHNHKSESEPVEDSKQIETLRDIIGGIKDEYFSDLQVGEIDDDQVSEINESDIDVSQIPEIDSSQELENKIKVQQLLVDKYAE